MTIVKICGFREVNDALIAAESGADYLGLVFVPSAGRCLDLDEAEHLLSEFRRQVTTEPTPQWIGLFGDQPVEEVVAITSKLRLDGVQLCGSEGMGYCGQMTVPVFKVITIDANVPVSVTLPRLMVLMQRHSMAGHRLVLDAHVEGEYGGTGERFPWDFIQGLSRSFQFSLAGGLTDRNVGDAIGTLRPWGVDTSSGVETDGRKDPVKIRAFVRAVRDVDLSLKPKGLSALFSRSKS